MRVSSSCATARNHSPVSVSVAGCEVRSNSTTPSHSSSARMRRLKAGCVMWRSSAAREKLPLAARARKSSSQDRFIVGALRAWKQTKAALVIASPGADHSDTQRRPKTLRQRHCSPRRHPCPRSRTTAESSPPSPARSPPTIKIDEPALRKPRVVAGHAARRRRGDDQRPHRRGVLADAARARRGHAHRRRRAARASCRSSRRSSARASATRRSTPRWRARPAPRRST